MQQPADVIRARYRAMREAAARGETLHPSLVPIRPIDDYMMGHITSDVWDAIITRDPLNPSHAIIIEPLGPEHIPYGKIKPLPGFKLGIQNMATESVIATALPLPVIYHVRAWIVEDPDNDPIEIQ